MGAGAHLSLSLSPTPHAHPSPPRPLAPTSTTSSHEQGKESVPDKDFTKQKMVLGTHTSDGEQNYLTIAEVRQTDSRGTCACVCERCM